jgi:hypothetical protein
MPGLHPRAAGQGPGHLLQQLSSAAATQGWQGRGGAGGPPGRQKPTPPAVVGGAHWPAVPGARTLVHHNKSWNSKTHCHNSNLLCPPLSHLQAIYDIIKCVWSVCVPSPENSSFRRRKQRNARSMIYRGTNPEETRQAAARPSRDMLRARLRCRMRAAAVFSWGT